MLCLHYVLHCSYVHASFLKLFDIFDFLAFNRKVDLKNNNSVQKILSNSSNETLDYKFKEIKYHFSKKVFQTNYNSNNQSRPYVGVIKALNRHKKSLED